MYKKAQQDKRMVYFQRIHSYSRLAGLLLVAISSSAVSASPYTITSSVIDSGGGESLSANYSIQSSLGQTALGSSSLTSYTLYAGFLSVPDTDGDSIYDNTDNCLIDSNPTQIDTDFDLEGNVCDLDDDNDGMPDDWEIANNLDPLNANDAAIDSDNDGLTNLEEYLGDTNPQIDQINLALDGQEYIWTITGDAPWNAQNIIYYVGNSALQSGAIGNNEQSSIETTVSGVGSVSFYWKVSSESGSDFLKFYIDDIEMASIDGEVEWHKQIFKLSSGSHTLRWSYTKDSASFGGSDAAWLDGISTQPTVIVPILFLLQ